MEQVTKVVATDWEKIGVIGILATMFFTLLGWYVYREKYLSKILHELHKSKDETIRELHKEKEAYIQSREQDFWKRYQNQESYWEEKLEKEREYTKQKSRIANEHTANLIYLLGKLVKYLPANTKLTKEDIEKELDKVGEENDLEVEE
jgi:hypothetical protein